MQIRAWWGRVVSAWTKFRPVRRRRTTAGHSAEAFEPRRLLSAFVVNSVADSHDAIPGDGIAADASGFTTLRAAVEEANAHAGADTITLPPGIIAVVAANGSLTVTEDVTIQSAGTTEIDGTVLDHVFSVSGGAHLQLDHVAVRSSHDLPISVPTNLLTTNSRQADLIVAFSAITSPTLTVETKTSNGLSPLIGITIPESVFDETPTSLRLTAIKPPALLDGSTIPTPEQAIDQIINALFRNEPDFVLPVGGLQKPQPISDEDSDEMLPKADRDPALGDEQSAIDTESDDTVRTVLRGWAETAGWQEFDFLTRGLHSTSLQPSHGGRVAAMAGMLLGSVAATTWSRDDRGSWRESLSAWRTRFDRLRRRAR